MHFCHPEKCHPELVSGSFNLRGLGDTPSMLPRKNKRRDCHGHYVPSQWRRGDAETRPGRKQPGKRLQHDTLLHVTLNLFQGQHDEEKTKVKNEIPKQDLAESSQGKDCGMTRKK